MTLQFNDENPDLPRIGRLPKTLQCLDHMEKKWIVQFILLCRKKSGPYRQLSRYDRTKIAGRVYTLLSDKDLVIIKKIGPDTYITITQKGRGPLKTIP
jgi:hypothetical protein